MFGSKKIKSLEYAVRELQADVNSIKLAHYAWVEIVKEQYKHLNADDVRLANVKKAQDEYQSMKLRTSNGIHK